MPHVAAAIEDLPAGYAPDVAVVAAPLEMRPDVLGSFAGLKGLIIEKPLAASEDDAVGIVSRCREQGVPLHVNYWRRSDRRFRELAAGRLDEMIGALQFGAAVYGGGLRNNGSHLVDFIRMLLGELVEVRALAPETAVRTLRGEGDWNVPFAATLASGAVVTVHGVDFQHYRENGLDLWGNRGRLSILNEGLTIQYASLAANRAITGEKELVHDAMTALPATVGDALFESYSGLAEAIERGTPPHCTGEDAIAAARVVDAVLRSARDGGTAVAVTVQ